jgi:hypothetical protein
MVKEAALAHFQQFPNRDLLARLRQLLNNANNFSPRRNEIAHGFVRPYSETNANRVGTGFVLCPSDYATNKTEITFLTMGMPMGRPFRFIRPDTPILRSKSTRLGNASVNWNQLWFPSVPKSLGFGMSGEHSCKNLLCEILTADRAHIE